MSKVKSPTMLELAQAGLNGDAEIVLLPSMVSFTIRAAADRKWITEGQGYNHVDWMYKTKADFDKHRAVAGRSWKFIPCILRFGGHSFATAVHSFNHSVRTAAGYDIVSPVVTRATEKDKNGNWVPGHHMCLWVSDTYTLRGKSTKPYDIDGRNAVRLAEQLANNALPTPDPVTVNYVVIVTGTGVNVRKGAGTNFESVCKVSRPQTFRIIRESVGAGANLWGMIADGQYRDRWIALDFTKPDTLQPQQKPANGDTYTVKAGDTLSEIARDFGIAMSALIELNGISDANSIKAGQVLKVPAHTKAPQKSIDAIAKEVIAGKWGVNPERAQRLEAAGYNAATVQARVREMLNTPEKPELTDLLNQARPNTHPQTANDEYIWKFCKAQGLSDVSTAGLIGNLYVESALKPNNLQNAYEKSLGYDDESYTKAVDDGSYTGFVRDSAGYGLCQWTFWSRKEGLLFFAKSKGLSIGDLGMQLEYMAKEMRGGVWNALVAAKTVREASDIVMLQFLKPADTSEKARSARANYGQGYFDRFKK